MKNVILSFVFIFLGTTAFAQIPNGDFETWNETTKDQLKGWNHIGNHTRTKDDAQTDAVKLITQNNNAGVIAYVDFQEDIENLQGGFSYKQRAAKLKVKMRYDIPVGDTAFIIMSFSAGGIPMSLDMKQIIGTNTSWATYTYDVTYFVPSMTPDSCVLGFVSGNIEGESIDGGWLEISSAEFIDGTGKTLDPIPNGDFKDWESVTTVSLDNWLTTTDFFRAFNSDKEPVKRTTDRTGGNYALVLETVEAEDDTSAGMAFVTKSTGLDFNSDGPNFEVSEKFLSFNGNYKYKPVGTDTCTLAAILYFQGTIIATAQLESGIESDTFMPFSVDFQYYQPLTPDSAALFIMSSDPEDMQFVGSKLWVDDLTFKTWLSSNEEVIRTPYVIYPNPAKDILNLSFEGNERYSLKLMDLNGKLLLEKEEVRGNTALNLDAVSNGIYMLSIESKNKKFTEKVIVK